jgi:hypothetical protein
MADNIGTFKNPIHKVLQMCEHIMVKASVKVKLYLCFFIFI